MADNYLERKMEEHRSGGGVPKKKISPVAGKRPGELTVKFPPRRVLVTGGAEGVGRGVVEAFRNADCTVDFIDADRAEGQRTAQRSGARFIPADASDPEQLARAVELILKSRGDIDIVASADSAPVRTSMAIARLLDCHRNSNPNPWGGRVILIDTSAACHSRDIDHLRKLLEPHGIMANVITAGTADSAGIARAALFFSLPDNKFSNGHIIL